ncbi:MAG: UvrD-helicase domain-containing protein [Syntrophorhabdus sp.]|jgi:F-box protein 18 (helicase)
MEYTEEQKRIIAYNPFPGEVVKVNAFAGTGKTTLLKGYTLARPNTKFLYVCFNKAIQEEAKKKFPPWVHCRTVHSLAYAAIGRKYKHKLIPSLKAVVVAQVLGIDDLEKVRCGIDTLHQYLISSDEQITADHVPHAVRYMYSRRKIDQVLQIANDLWNAMGDVNEENIGATHDYYLKRYQLMRQKLKYDVVLIDEAQDTNMVSADILLSQKGAAKILVGDHHQAIYGFRGSTDIMQQFGNARRFYLTQSFRFPQKVANLSNLMLYVYKGETKKIRGLSEPPGKIGPINETPFTIIARTNAELFQQAITWHDKKKLAFVGGVRSYRFDEILNTYFLYSRQEGKITLQHIKLFETYERMVAFADEVNDIELKSRIRLIERYKNGIPLLIHRIREAAVSQDKADIILVSGHRAKGLEFPSVKLSNDFVKLVRKHELVDPEDVDPQDINLAYVAITRAQRNLELPPRIVEFVSKVREMGLVK